MCSDLYPPSFDKYMLYRLEQGFSREQSTYRLQRYFQERLQGNRPDIFQAFLFWNTVKPGVLHSHERRWVSVVKEYEKGLL